MDGTEKILPEKTILLSNTIFKRLSGKQEFIYSQLNLLRHISN